MKKQVLFFGLICATILSACKEDDPVQNPTIPQSDQALYVLNEGNFNQNNSTLGLFSISSNSYQDDFFDQKNQRGLGSIGNDMAKYGGKLYVVVNVSGTVEILDKNTGVVVQQLQITNGGANREPRNIAFYGGDFYLVNNDNSVLKYDTTNFQLQASATAGRNPDGVVVKGDKLVVTNSGGADFSNLNNTISVFGLPGLNLIETIEVGLNPGTIVVDNQENVYVHCRGNYEDVAASIVKLNSQLAIDTTFAEAPFGLTFNGEKVYFAANNEAGNLAMKSINPQSNEVIIESGFSMSGISTVNKLSTDELGNIYVSDAKNYVSTGDIIGFSPSGARLFTQEVGIIPSKVVRR
jgi:hypothetical protein